jgi:four helix bundle protein
MMPLASDPRGELVSTGRAGKATMEAGMTADEMPIFTRSFDLIAWLLQASNHFPRVHRHGLTRRLQDAAFDLRERLEEANARRGDARRTSLALADEALSKLRMYLRLAHRFGWLSAGQYGHAAELTAEIGRLIGGWRKASHV